MRGHQIDQEKNKVEMEKLEQMITEGKSIKSLVEDKDTKLDGKL